METYPNDYTPLTNIRDNKIPIYLQAYKR